jgi:hypothetical protein
MLAKVQDDIELVLKKISETAKIIQESGPVPTITGYEVTLSNGISEQDHTPTVQIRVMLIRSFTSKAASIERGLHDTMKELCECKIDMSVIPVKSFEYLMQEIADPIASAQETETKIERFGTPSFLLNIKYSNYNNEFEVKVFDIVRSKSFNSSNTSVLDAIKEIINQLQRSQ